jgi:hypothetical protein
MIISKDSNNNWTPVATGNGTFVGTKTAFDAVKDDLPDNTVAYTTDDGVELCQYPNYTGATTVYNKSKNHTTESESWTMTETVTVPSTGWYRILTAVTNISAGVSNNSIWVDIGSIEISKVSQTSSASWVSNMDVVVVPIKKDTVITAGYNLPSGMRGDVIIQKIS